MRSMAGERTHRIGCTVLADEFQNGCVVNLAFKCLAIDLYEFNLVYKILRKSNHGNKAYVFFVCFLSLQTLKILGGTLHFVNTCIGRVAVFDIT